ncbi:MAG: hypothetical protein JW883_08860, partial [Deltaproteobacteria bacterium]|nr:hypothetical protein [Deltaproteobacteria bacterium]
MAHIVYFTGQTTEVFLASRGLLQDFVRYLVIHHLEFNMTLQRSSNPITGVQLIPGRTCAVFRIT